jgi:hypothetical protein
MYTLQRISICIFPEQELNGLSPNFHINMPLSDFYNPTTVLPIFLKQNRQTDRGNIKIAHRNMNVGIVAAQFLSWEYLFRIYCHFAVQLILIPSNVSSCIYVNMYLIVELLRGVLGNKCGGHHNLKTVKIREIM